MIVFMVAYATLEASVKQLPKNVLIARVLKGDLTPFLYVGSSTGSQIVAQRRKREFSSGKIGG